MTQPNPATGKARWFSQFVLYLVLFALLISAGAYFLLGQDDSPSTTTPAAAPPPAGQSGHDAPQAPNTP